MKHMASGTIAFIGVLALAGCYSDPGAAINNSNYNTVQASPNFVKVKVGDSTEVIARLVNDADNGALTSYTIGGGGAGILVHNNPNYRPIFDSKRDTLVQSGDKVAQQYFVVGSAVGRYTFTLTPTAVNTGISATVSVVVTPRDLGTALSKHTGAPGDTVVITALAGTVFSQTSVVTFATGTLAVVARAADSSSITIVVSGGVTGTATITKVGVAAAPAVTPATMVTADALVTTAEVLGSVLSTNSAAAGATVTITAPANQFFSQTSAISFTTGATSITSRSADGKTISFLVGPGITGPVTVTNVGLISAPTLPLLTFTSSDVLVTTALSVAPTTLGSAAPALGTSTTVALGSGLRFLGNSHIFVGGSEAGIVSVSADSSTATIVPMTGSTGTLSYTNISLSFLTSVPLALPGDKSMTVGSVYSGPTDPNANVAANATTITLTGGRSTLISDGGALTTSCSGAAIALFGASSCRFYKITIPAGTVSANIKWSSGTTADMSVMLFDVTGVNCVAVLADNQGLVDGTVGDHATQPINCAESANVPLAAGTYLLTVLQFNYGGTVPFWYQFRISQP